MARFFTSDIHFGDKRLNLFGRDSVFKTSEEFDNKIIENWNNTITDKDTVFCLGDIALSEDALVNIGKCNGKKILVKGNYDEAETAKYDISDELLSKYFVKIVKHGFIDIDNEKIYMTHCPVDGKDDYFNLVGHIHEKWKVQRNMINVGTDAWHFFPVSEAQIIFTINAVRKYFDENVFAGELEVNIDKKPKNVEITTENKKIVKESKCDSNNVVNEKLLTPPEILKHNKNEKFVFLAGPIQGAPEWHQEAIEFLSKGDGFKIASPKKKYKPKDFDYDKQVNWESHYLDLASKNGVIVFWLAKEEKHDPERSYAQTTRFELAEWLTKQTTNKNIKILVGIEEGFSGQKYIEKKIKDEYKTVGKIYYNLEELCKQAIKIINK